MLPGAEVAHLPLAGEVAMVTGASTGIGALTAQELARRGATVMLVAPRGRELDAQVQLITEAGGEARAIPADLTEPGDVMSLIGHARASYGRVDVLVNNSGADWYRPLACSPLGEISGLVGVNLLAAMCLTRSLLPEMLERRHGAVILVGSVLGQGAMEPVYSATTYGLRGFSLALRRQLAGTGVSVSLVFPSDIYGARTCHVATRMGGPDPVATAIADLVRHPRREVVVPRKRYAVAWLEQTLPGMTDLVHHRRHWSPVREKEAVTWTS
jgi:short-subunit dehydrogenase